MKRRAAEGLLTALVISVPAGAWAFEAGVALTASHVLGLALLLVTGLVWLRERRPIPIGWAGIALLAFLGVAAVSVARVQFEPDIQAMGESSHGKSVKQLVGLVFGLGIFAGLRCVMRWYGLAAAAVRLHFWTCSVVAALALVQYGIAQWDLTHPLANWSVHNSTFGPTRALSLMYGFPRVSLSMVEPSMLAAYLMTGWAFWLFTSERPSAVSGGVRLLHALGGCVIGVALVTSGSRLAYVACALLATIAVALRSHRVWRGSLVAASVVIGLIVTGPQHSRNLVNSLLPKARPAPVALALNTPEVATPRKAVRAAAPPPPVRASAAPRAPVTHAPAPSVRERVGGAFRRTLQSTESSVTRNDLSVQHRVASYLVAARVVAERPWLGSGVGTSAFYMLRYWPETFVPIGVGWAAAPSMMSHYATIVTETGIVGTMCLVVFVSAVLAALWSMRRRLGPDRLAAAGVAAALAAYAIASSATALVVYQNLLVWVLLAAALELGVGEADEGRPLGGDFRTV